MRQPAHSAFLDAMALLFVAAALFHLWHACAPQPGDPSGPVRHMVFVGINLAMAVALRRQPAWLPIPFGFLVLQQVGSHGAAAWLRWCDQGELDVVSIAIVVLLPLTWVYLWRNRRSDRVL